MAWYFLRVPGCGTLEAVQTLKTKIACLGRVYECDLGTEEVSDAGWYTVNIALDSVQAVRERLKALGLSERVDHIDALIRARDGRSASRQLGLF